MVRLNTIVSTLDKNPKMQEPHIHGSMRKIGHVRSIWQSLPPNSGPHWFGVENAAPGTIASKGSSAAGSTAAGALEDSQKPRYPYFDPAKAQ